MALTLTEMHSLNCKLFGSRTCKYRQSSILWTKKVKGRIVCSWCWPNPLNDHVEDWSGDHEMWWCVHGCAQSALPTHSPCTLVTHTCVTIIVSLPPCSAPTCGPGSVTAGETILMILWWWHLSVSTGVWHSLLCAAVSPLTTHCIDVDGLETRPTLQYTCHLGAPTVHLYTVSVHRAPVYTAPLYRHLSCISGGSESPWWHDQAAQECQQHENITTRVGRWKYFIAF